MMKIWIIAVSIFTTLLLYFVNIWLKEEAVNIDRINKKYEKDIRKLKKIKRIDDWIKKDVKQHLVPIPKNPKAADLKLIKFFDLYAKEYDFKVKKFIYKDKMARYLNIKYSLSRKNSKKLLQFMQQEYKNGYNFIESLTIDKEIIKGTIILIQPYPSKNEKILNEEIEDVP